MPVLQFLLSTTCLSLVAATRRAPVVSRGFCNSTRNMTLFTSCESSVSLAKVQCPPGSSVISSGRRERCSFYVYPEKGKTSHIQGSRHQCLRTVVEKRCCDGYWGENCDECPGGADTPCSGHGHCSEGIKGSGICTCEENFDGVACEMCANSTLYGSNCTDVCGCVSGKCDSGITGTGLCTCFSGYKGQHCDEAIEECRNVTCPLNARCVQINGNTQCVCDANYEDGGNGRCRAIDMCRSAPCSQFADCDFTGPGIYMCRCHDGYRGDGFVCEPIDPCQTKSGGCVTNTSDCVYMGPGKSSCHCHFGHENYKAGSGCSLINVCTVDSSECPEHATCHTIASGDYECVCDEGYVRDGKRCYGNIVERLKELNSKDPLLKDQLTLSLQMVQNLYTRALTEHGPFTIFVPTNRGFRSIINTFKSFQSFLSNVDKASQILRQHVIAGQLSLHEMYNATIFYTLQGTSAELSVRNKMFRFRLHGARNKAKIISGNITASNGIIHVINALLSNEPEINGNYLNENQDNQSGSKNLEAVCELSVKQLLKEEGRFNRFESLIAEADMSSSFFSANITVFAPSNSAWDALPSGTLEYLQSIEGQGALQALIMNHIFRGKITVAELINMQRIRSVGNTSFDLFITAVGQLKIGGRVNLSQADIPTYNGIIHQVEGVLVPGEIESILPHRCDFTRNVTIQGPCGPCLERSKCDLPSDELMETKLKGCTYWINHQTHYKARIGCQSICRRKHVEPKCCDGFYGSSCTPCPGNFRNPCSGHGVCLDGIRSNGTCFCDKNFGGAMCDSCSSPSHFGPNCSTSCTCVHGVCDGGPTGTGICKRGSCLPRYSGINCDQSLVTCGFELRQCHTYSYCANDGDTISCKCWQGYEGNGITCTEIDPCQKPDRGGCHAQAACTKIAPGVSKCTCEDGWLGNGLFCYPSTACIFHRECHLNATCENTSPGQYICVCKKGFHGDGMNCIADDPCVVNNGGCHSKAKCTSTGMGTKNCTCSDGYSGNGITWCDASIAVELQSNPDLTELASIVKNLPLEENFLDDLDSMENYTFFAPTNDAIRKFNKLGPYSYWTKKRNIDALLGYHTLNESYTLDSLRKLGGPSYKFNTLIEGVSLQVISRDNAVIVKTRLTEAKILRPNIPALNGYIHIIDRVLEYVPVETDNPLLDEFFEDNQEYSDFGELLDDNGLIEKLEAMDQYTLFVPPNSILKSLNKTMSARFLSFYIVPTIILSASITDGETVQTVLGQLHQLSFAVKNDKLLVNNVTIIQPDLLTLSGVIYIIDGLLMAVLHRCDITIPYRAKGECRPCRSTEFPCPSGFSQANPPLVLENSCTYSEEKYTMGIVGCHAVCENRKVIPACCSGYYGSNCSECPGSADNVCSGHGMCSDGLNGTGLCACDDNFAGLDCGQCQEGLVGPSCNYSKNSCDYMNGGCGPNSVCEIVEGMVTCKCKLGYIGNEFNCHNPCEIQNGGCNERAICEFKDGYVNCTCREGEFGDGKQKCKPISNPCYRNNGNCSHHADCIFVPPAATELEEKTICRCIGGFVGNGTMCNKNIYDTIERMSFTQQFLQLLRSVDKANPEERWEIISNLEDISLNLTLFVPVGGALLGVKMLSNRDLRNHIVGQGIYIRDDLQNSLPVTTTAGQSWEIVMKANEFFLVQKSVRSIKVIERNIPATNGFIHFTAEPLLYDTGPLQEKEKGAAIDIIVGSVVGTLLVILIIIITIVLFRHYKYHTRIYNFWHHFRKGSDTSISFQHLQASEESDEATEKKIIQPYSDFQNPLYDIEDDFAINE